MLSRWTDFLNSDGEKEWRNRDAEFENDIKDKVELMEKWESGWQCLFDALDSVTEANLNRGVARIEGTANLDEADNMGIAGHRDGYFRVLKDVVVGDVIEMTTATGMRRYLVAETFIVEPEEVWVLEPGNSASLTLVTCYPFYFVGSAPQRFIVRAHLDAGA